MKSAPKAAPEGRPKRQRPEGPIRFRTSYRNVVYAVLKGRPGWVETDSDVDWDVEWNDRVPVYARLSSTHLQPWQRVNHFPNGREVSAALVSAARLFSLDLDASALSTLALGSVFF